MIGRGSSGTRTTGCAGEGLTRRRFLGASAATAALAAAPGLVRGGEAPAGARLNVVLITADDLGLQLSCYGEKRLATPRLDALAAAGVRFESAYVAQSSCSPSRAAILTGRWPHECGQVGLAHLGFRMPPGQALLPTLLHDAGYYTGIIGKLHVAPEEAFSFDWRPAGQRGYAAPPTRKVRWVAEQSRAFFAQAKAAGRPFFYYVNYFDPHGPYTPDVNQVDGVPEKPLQAAEITDPLPLNSPTPEARKRVTAAILNTIARVDVGVGLLLDELEASGEAGRTLVVFVGDNGLPVARGKTYSYEPGVRVPLLVRWPGEARASQVRPELVSTLDLMPTILAAAGVAPPAGLAGRPLQPLLRGETVTWRELLFTEMNFHEPDILRLQRSVRDARYKLVLNLAPAEGSPGVELFDLQGDPGEERNLAADPALAAVRTRLQDALQEWRVATHDPVLDVARLERWRQAAATWQAAKAAKPVTAGKREVLNVPPAEVDRALW